CFEMCAHAMLLLLVRLRRRALLMLRDARRCAQFLFARLCRRALLSMRRAAHMLGSGHRHTQPGQANAFAFQVSSEEWANCTASREVEPQMQTRTRHPEVLGANAPSRRKSAAAELAH